MSEYGNLAILILLVTTLAGLIIALTHVIMPLLPEWLIGPRRSGRIKDSTYESGVDPIGDARHRFNVRFYLVAVLFLLFDVEILFLYPWTVLYRRFGDANDTQMAQLAAAGFGPGFFLATALIFFFILAVGFFYEWRKGIFKWD
ncbi:MAG: NADH-quinone oxidoreductase subunit A [Planctomycetota bacterium]